MLFNHIDARIKSDIHIYSIKITQYETEQFPHTYKHFTIIFYEKYLSQTSKMYIITNLQRFFVTYFNIAVHRK